jgi:hypothetical protein
LEQYLSFQEILRINYTILNNYIYFQNKNIFIIYRLFRGVSGDIEATNAYTMLIVMILVLLLAFIFGTKDPQEIRFNSNKNYMLVAVLIQIFASQSSEVRAGYYYYLFISLLIPEVIKNLRDPKVRIIVVGVLILAFMYFFQKTTGNGYLDVSPYQFYWE